MSKIRAAKAELRARLLRTRRGLTSDELRAAGAALATSVRELPSLAAATTVAAYVSTGTEPDTHPMIDALRESGTRVLLPVLLPDNDLDWAEYDGRAALEATPRGLLEPAGAHLGPLAVAEAQAVLLPGLAVDRQGVRLGRGGGSYDRVLARLAATGTHPALVVVLYAHEVVETVPKEPHDHLVDAAMTPNGVQHFIR
ncbi:5-formyltetrahydrofolate cyclo-ligase [Streptomyces polygonati]|uniref:5-formyltetrahydrofolate cyclo-ligase n=1 Tax=Streptomyces polygonati TaxID=1617087 RepID=A0ABV8HSD3_9ACTN